MVRNVDSASRRRAILKATINRYIKEARPVASEDIARDFALSSATVRNVFADLEEVGYITHPYTSGGRIPTNKGYRYYVDFLLSEIDLLEEEKVQINSEYKEKIDRLEDVLEKTSKIISNITHYAAIVSFLEWQDRFFYKGINLILEQPEFQDVERIGRIIKMIEDRNPLLDLINRDSSGNTKVYIGGEELGCPQMETCSLVVSSYYFKDKPLGRLAVLGPKRMEYEHAIPALEYISDILTDILDKI